MHDRDSIVSRDLDQRVQNLGLRVLPTPPQCPQAHALFERLGGTLRRECVDFLMPLSEFHLRRLLKVWVLHYNTGLPPHKIVLFGSYSYRTPTADSDVNLLVIMDTTTPVQSTAIHACHVCSGRVLCPWICS
jgi:hypothetical protein